MAGKLNVPLEYWAANSLNKQKDCRNIYSMTSMTMEWDELFIGHTRMANHSRSWRKYLDGKTQKSASKLRWAKQVEPEVFSFFKGGLPHG